MSSAFGLGLQGFMNIAVHGKKQCMAPEQIEMYQSFLFLLTLPTRCSRARQSETHISREHRVNIVELDATIEINSSAQIFHVPRST